jgi:hypothetical protein
MNSVGKLACFCKKDESKTRAPVSSFVRYGGGHKRTLEEVESIRRDIDEELVF